MLYKAAGFVSQIVHNCPFFVPGRALNTAPFSACEPHTQTQTGRTVGDIRVAAVAAIRIVGGTLAQRTLSRTAVAGDTKTITENTVAAKKGARIGEPSQMSKLLFEI